jgi:hypothetical protein
MTTTIDRLKLDVTFTVSEDYHSWEAVLKSRWASEAASEASLLSLIGVGEPAALSEVEVRSAGVTMAAKGRRQTPCRGPRR